MTEQSWAQLGRFVQERRRSLGKSQTDLAMDGGPSDVTLSKIEQGHPGPYRSKTLTALERALCWRPGTIEAVLAGEDPAYWEATDQRAEAMPQFEVSPETDALVARDLTARAGLAFLDLVHRHYGADQDSAAVHSSVTEFVQHILTRESI